MQPERHVLLRQRQIAGLLLLALAVLLVTLARAHRGSLFPPGWWRW
jgi:hypothetical protein